ncbi:hypothetical protein MRX96_001693 [Rhipicephalus microplus]
MEDFRSNGDAGSPADEFLVNGNRRQESPPEREPRGPKNMHVEDDHGGQRKKRTSARQDPPGETKRQARLENEMRSSTEGLVSGPFREDFFGENGHDDFSLREPQRRPNDPQHRQRSSRQQYSLSDPPSSVNNGDPLAEQSLSKPMDELEPIRPSREVDRVTYRREVVEQPRGQSHFRPAVDVEPHRSSRDGDRTSYRREEGEPRRGHSLTRPKSDIEPRRPSREAERAKHSFTRPNSDIEPHLPTREAERSSYRHDQRDVVRGHSLTRNDTEVQRSSRDAEKVGYHREEPRSALRPLGHQAGRYR